VSAAASLREELSFRFKKPETLSLGKAVEPVYSTPSYSAWGGRKSNKEKNDEVIKWCVRHGWNEGACVARKVPYGVLTHDNNREWGMIVRHYDYAPDEKVLSVRWGGSWNDVDYHPRDLILLNPASGIKYMRERISDALKKDKI